LKSITIERLARQIEAEYAFLIEREVGHSHFPVIECGALFDHIESPLPSSFPSPSRRRRRSGSARKGRLTSQEGRVTEDGEDYGGYEDSVDNNELYETDEREEAESRGVQLRFTDKIEDVLDRNSTVHVVNIDQ
ncbi:hypothetical protein BX616_008660, partial [Lobosporangium transversale]